jgi:hypothetical protein
MRRKVTDLRPTQFAVGLFEVEKKMDKLQKLKKEELEPYLEDHPVPGVLYRNDEIFLIDHHHLVRACWELDIEKVNIKIAADLSHLSEKEFWAELDKKGWHHLYDQFGKGPHDPGLLPSNVRGLADDLYRSLAWALREAGGYEKTDVLFCEFLWANFLRTRVPIGRGEEGFKKALDAALLLARSDEAKKLPGFIPAKTEKKK